MSTEADLLFGALLAFVLVIMYTASMSGKGAHEAEHETVGRPARPPALSYPPPPLLDTAGVLSPGCAGGCAAADRQAPPLYHSDEIDELVTGTLYRKGERERAVYAARTSHGDSWGLEEYSDGRGNPGDVGYDVGPIGVARPCKGRRPFDDGMPANWDLPSTPMQFFQAQSLEAQSYLSRLPEASPSPYSYSTVGEDYFGPEGPTVYCGAGLEITSVGDREPYES